MPRCDQFQGRILWHSTLVLLAGVLTFVIGLPSLASAQPNSPGDSQPACEEPDSAAALVKAMYDSCAWVDRAKSFSIRVERITSLAEKELPRQAQQPAPYSRPGDRTPKTSIGTEEWAWDETRIHCRDESRGTRADLRIWDGKFAIECSQSASGEHQQYVLGDKPGKFFESLVENALSFRWGPGGSHRFWWQPLDVDQARADRYLAPKDFEFDGEEAIDGRVCRVVLSRAGHTRLHLGKNDGRLYRRTWYFVSSTSPGYDLLTLCRRIGGDQIKTVHHWQQWIESLEPPNRSQARREWAEARFNFARPIMRESLDDYREIAPGCWLPFRLTQDTYETNAPQHFLSSKTKVTVTHATVNQPLAEELFEFELKDGVKVATDSRYDPPIRYTYRHEQTEHERRALCEAERQKQAAAKAEIEGR